MKPLLVLLLLLPQLSSQSEQARSRANSDWWSVLIHERTIKSQKLDTPDANFQVLGVTLDEPGFSNLTTRLGQATRVTRGDAATGRSYQCYVSNDNATHLIFEKGEISYAFYLFSGGPDWKGSQLCTRSAAIARQTGSGSGLHLGMSPSEVETILGQPNISAADTFTYSRVVRKETPAEELKRIQERSPRMSAEELQGYRFYDLSVFIQARFTDGKLTYLAVMKSETS